MNRKVIVHLVRNVELPRVRCPRRDQSSITPFLYNDPCHRQAVSIRRGAAERNRYGRLDGEVDLRNQANAAGDWFVDTRCIDCGTCREIAPGLFDEDSGLSVVRRQPSNGEELDAWLAAQACPTTSIGTVSRHPRPGRLYPREIQHGSGVFDLGYCSEDSFGASAWLVVRPAGNVLVDSPRFTEALARPIAELGGIRHVAFTHRDDVADGRRWAERFGARSWIHTDDRTAAPWATDLLAEEQELQPGSWPSRYRDTRRDPSCSSSTVDGSSPAIPSPGATNEATSLPSAAPAGTHGARSRTHLPLSPPVTASAPSCPATAPATSVIPTTSTLGWSGWSSACEPDPLARQGWRISSLGGRTRRRCHPRSTRPARWRSRSAGSSAREAS